MAASLDSGASVQPPLQHWHDVLLHWCNLVERLCHLAPRAVPWWQNEVTNTALLAAAAIQCGHVALVETSIAKRERSGRSDLWVQFGVQETQGAQEECVEVKFENYEGRGTDEKLRAALDDARKITLPCRARIGACFFKIINPESFETVTTDIARICGADALAWSFPACVRDLEEKPGRGVPGVVLAMKVV